MIVQKDGKYLLKDKDTNKTLGTHDTFQKAIKQEYAIAKNQKKSKKSIQALIKEEVARNYKKACEKIALSVTDAAPWYMRPVSATIGRLQSPVTSLLLGTTAPLGNTASLEDPEILKVLQELKDNDVLKNTHVDLGGSNISGDLSRIWHNPKTSILSKALGLVKYPFTTAVTAVHRADHYDPYSDTVTLYSPVPAVLRHELGHAEDFTNTNYPGLYALMRSIIPGVPFIQETNASINAVKHQIANSALMAPGSSVKDVNDALDAVTTSNRQLGGALGTYLGGGAAGLMALYPRISKYLDAHIGKIGSNRLRSMLTAASGSPLVPLVGVLGGAALGQLIGATTLPFVSKEDRDVIRAAKKLRDQDLVDRAKQALEGQL